MLTLTRKVGETLVVDCGGVPLKIVVMDIRGQQAHVGIEAPKDWDIRRAELLTGAQLEWLEAHGMELVSPTLHLEKLQARRADRIQRKIDAKPQGG